jgi:signal transduction histidine kinase
LPEELSKKLFMTFYTTKPQGMGLGLNICRSIIEFHGGRIWASTHPEGGSTFSFTLPVADN